MLGELKYEGPEDLLSLSPGEFEDLTVELFRLRGHKAKRTGSIGDHGVDVQVCTKDGEKWVVQCKRWRSSVGEPIIRDFYGVVQHEKAYKGVIITTSNFTHQAKQWAKGKPMLLIDGQNFVKYLKQARKLKPEVVSDGVTL
jgi:restriction system protein